MEEEICGICYRELTIKNKVNTSCNHEFCTMCFFRWLRTNNSCAMCRKDFLNEDVQRETLETLCPDIIDLHVRGEKIMLKNIKLIEERRQLEKIINEKNDELNEKEKRNIYYDEKIRDRKTELKKIEEEKRGLQKKIRLMKLKSINLKIKKLRLSGRIFI